MAHGQAAVERIRRMHGTQALAKGVRRYPPLGERMRALLLAAPGILRERGYEPAPKPYRPRRWKSKIWIGRLGAVGWRSRYQHPSSSFPNWSGGSAASRGGRFIP